MVIPDEDIIRFQKIYKQHFGKEISREFAIEQGIKLMRLVSIVYQPMTKEELKNIKARRKELEIEN